MSTLVLGYGNPSRGDDGVGWCVVRELEERDLPDVRLETSHQLDLEFAEIVSEFDSVFFVDAAVADSPEPITRSEIRPRMHAHTTSHHLLPSDVLALCACLYGKEPEAVLYTIRGESFGFAAEISRAAAEAAREVADEIAERVLSGLAKKAAHTVGESEAGSTA